MKKENQQDYLKNLLNKHEKTRQLSESFVMGASKHYEDDIKTGRYNIKEGDKFIKKSRHLSRADIQNMKDIKRNLEQNLDIIDSRVGELTEPEDKKNNIIDQNQRRKFVTQMSKARKQLQKHRQKKYKEREQKQKQIIEKEVEEIKKKEEEEINRRKHEIMKRAQSLQIQKKQKQAQIQQQNKIYKIKMHQKILSERMLEKYRQNQAKDLQQQKKRLAQLRNLHKPLTKSEFQEHLQKYDKLKSSRKINNKSQSKIFTQKNKNTKFYKSNWYKVAKQAPIQFLDDKHQHELEHVKEMKDKLKKYAEYVKQNFKPEIDRRKTKSTTQKNKTVPVPKQEDLRELGLRYLQYSKQKIDITKKQQNNQQEERRIIKPINYLQKLKKDHEGKGHLSAKQYVENIKSKTNLSESEKAQKILDYVDSLERKAKLREEKGKINKAYVDEELDNLYMEAIAMKLSVLGKET